MSPDDTDDIRSAVSRKASSATAGSDAAAETRTFDSGEDETGATGTAQTGTAETSRLQISDPDTTPTETIMDTDRATTPVAPTTSSTSTQSDPHDTAVTHDDVVVHAAAPDRGIRVGTVVWGLVIAAVGIGLIAYTSGQRFDVDLAVIILIAAAGVALLVGSLLSNRRRPR